MKSLMSLPLKKEKNCRGNFITIGIWEPNPVKIIVWNYKVKVTEIEIKKIMEMLITHNLHMK